MQSTTANPTPAATATAAAPELLAPAGDWEAMRAAVANGADAVYFGLQGGFNARYRAENFSLDELPRVMDYLNAHNVRGYVAFNTLVFSDELPEALRFVRAVAAAGADAIIVQDLGLAQLIARMCPGLHVHGSTQMTLTEPLGIEFVRGLGVRRVILARELSKRDVEKITAATDLPVEVFVHGALCVSYSGQCLTSEAIGGRSANRGQCAQACRLPYDLVVDGTVRDLGEKAYLLSPQDLAAHDLVGDLAALGVCSLKIEGRLKSAHYVAATTQTYRAAIDAAAAAEPFKLARQKELDLAQSFSRGFTHGFFDGVNHQELVHARFPKSRGVRVGTVVGKTRHGVLVELGGAGSDRGRHGFTTGGELNVGDGVVFDEGHPEQDEQGGRIATVRPVQQALQQGRHRPRGRDARGVVEISFDRGGVNLGAVSVGATVWKTDDPAARRRLEQSFSRDVVARRVPLAAAVSARIGEHLAVVVRDDAGHEATVTWDRPLEAAQKFPLTEALFREQFGRLGDTPFELGEVTGLETPSGTMVPKSVLNDLRRRAVEQLVAAREDRERRAVVDPYALEHARAEIVARFADVRRPTSPHPRPAPEGEGGCRPAFSASPADQRPASLSLRGRAGVRASSNQGCAGHDTSVSDNAPPAPSLHVLARTLDQLRALLAWKQTGPGAVLATGYCEFEDIRQYKEAVALARGAGVPIGLATVRIIKPGEEGLLRQVAACEPDCVLVRNLAGLSFFSAHAPHLPLVADYALNVSNEITAALLADRGVRRIVPSYDLNWTQLSAMLKRFPPAMFEAVVHQHMPMFHMEHCVFCHTLSTGTDYRDCGRPCDTHKVDLRDRVGAANPLVADVGCRNTVYNGVAQSAAEYVPRMLEMGIRDYRVELLRETADEVAPLLDRYARVLGGAEDGRTAWRQLKVLGQLGVTRGTLGE